MATCTQYDTVHILYMKPPTTPQTHLHKYMYMYTYSQCWKKIHNIIIFRPLETQPRKERCHPNIHRFDLAWDFYLFSNISKLHVTLADTLTGHRKQRLSKSEIFQSSSVWNLLEHVHAVICILSLFYVTRRITVQYWS